MFQQFNFYFVWLTNKMLRQQTHSMNRENIYMYCFFFYIDLTPSSSSLYFVLESFFSSYIYVL